MRVHFVKFLGHHLFVSKCARVGGIRVVEGDSVDDNGVDVIIGVVVCGLDRRKSTVEKGRDGEVLAWVDITRQHGQASRQDQEKVGEEQVEVDKFHRSGNEWRIDAQRFINHKDFPCIKYR